MEALLSYLLYLAAEANKTPKMQYGYLKNLLSEDTYRLLRAYFRYNSASLRLELRS
jgi:hypothetical protein